MDTGGTAAQERASSDSGASPAVAVVAIGRNEGERLAACLRSVPPGVPCVYVDSGSRDGSPERAAGLGAHVVELDPARPFSAARARNAGFARACALWPALGAVQFVDGDCALREGWLERGRAELAARPELGVVCGRRRERHPEASRYDLLADLEWDTPVGEATACGGDALFRRRALEAAGGFREELIAGEEPELCLRLRRLGWRVARLDAEMTWHEAGITRSSQWWRRQVRTGHAYAEGAWLHGRGPERFRVRELASALAWGAALPLLALGAAPASAGASLAAGAAAYLVLFLRTRRARRARGARAANLYAAGVVAGKPALAQGALRFLLGRLTRRPAALIEYKGDAPV